MVPRATPRRIAATGWANPKLILAAGGATLTLALGCSGDDGVQQTQERIVRTGATEVEVTSKGQLKTEPAPLTIADLRKPARGSAEAAVMELWFWGQWGSVPNIVGMYHPDVRATVGIPNITGAFSQQREAMVSSLPRIAATRQTALGSFVAVEVLSKANPVARESFLLRRRSGDWQIIYDTLLERAVAGYVQTVTEGRLSPGAKEASPIATRAGTAAARTYRNLFVDSRAEPIGEAP